MRVEVRRPRSGRALAGLLAVSAATLAPPLGAEPAQAAAAAHAVQAADTVQAADAPRTVAGRDAQPADGATGALRTTPAHPEATRAGTARVSIPTGALTITTPYTSAHPLDLGPVVPDAHGGTFGASAPLASIVITDRRAGDPGFIAAIVANPFRDDGHSFPGRYAGLTGLSATQLPGNALQASDVTLVDHPPYTDGLATTKTFATYPAGRSIGSVVIAGTFSVAHVPTSVRPGRYTSLVVFTAF